MNFNQLLESIMRDLKDDVQDNKLSMSQEVAKLVINDHQIRDNLDEKDSFEPSGTTIIKFVDDESDNLKSFLRPLI